MKKKTKLGSKIISLLIAGQSFINTYAGIILSKQENIFARVYAATEEVTGTEQTTTNTENTQQTTQQQPIKYTKEIEFLSQLGVIKEDVKEFRAKENISKGEWLELVFRATDQDEVVDKMSFSPLVPGVAEDNKYIGPINAAVEWGLIDKKEWIEEIGDAKGKFNPDGTLFVSDALTPLVKTLGFGEKVNEERPGIQGRAQSYMKIARSLGLFDDIDLHAYNQLTREDAAKIIFNALFAPYNQGDVYMEPEQCRRHSLLRDRLKIETFVGTVDTATKDKITVIDDDESVYGVPINGKISTPTKGTNVRIYYRIDRWSGEKRIVYVGTPQTEKSDNTETAVTPNNNEE